MTQSIADGGFMKWTMRFLALAFASTLGACCVEPEPIAVSACAPYPCYAPIGGYCDYGYGRGFYGYARGNYCRPEFYGRTNFYSRPIPYGRPTRYGQPSASHGGWHGGGAGGFHGSGSHQGHR